MGILQEGRRFTRLIVGLFLYALGTYLRVQANLGLAPWDALNQGIALVGGMSMGDASIVVGVIIILIDILLGEQVGIGSILNAVLLGTFYNWMEGLEFIPLSHNLWEGIVMLILSLFVVSFATYFYIGPGLGCGPRDSLMVALCRRLPNRPVGLVRGCLEGVALLVGCLCGAVAGIGTIISVVGIGFVMQLVFRVFHFDVTTIRHENVIDTWRRWRDVKTKS